MAMAWSNLTSLILLFGLYAPVSQLYFEETDIARRRQIYGSLFLFQSVTGAIAVIAVAGILRALGSVQLSTLHLALWIGYLTSLNLIPMTLMRVREQAKRYAAVSIIVSAANAGGPLVSVLLGRIAPSARWLA